MIELVRCTEPKAVMIENVRGLLDPKFDGYRSNVTAQFQKLGYALQWRLLHASEYGVGQLRPRVVAVGIHRSVGESFRYPEPSSTPAPTVGELLEDLMAEKGWAGASAWAAQADRIAPTLVGGSKKHGGPDLGPTRARRAWAELGVNGSTLAAKAPASDFDEMPRLTVRIAARVQGFPDDWEFVGAKTNAYRRVGNNAFPPPVAEAVGAEIIAALSAARQIDTAA